jgi:hypothetical protein
MTETALSGLKGSLRGEIIRREDTGYDAARKVYNGMIDRRPRLIVRCRDTADVIAAVRFGREQNLLVAIRGGGHNGGGLGVCDDGLVIDLSGMRGVRVDPASATVRVDGGCTWGDVDHATHAFGMATPSGIISSTGVGGLTLGGGIGHLSRKYGLTIDNLLAVDMVLADGRFVTASAQENPDLFWAVRGGGGNFGVVTSFQFRLHPVDTVHAGPMFWPIEHSAEVMQFYREFITSAPEDVNGFFAFLTVPPAPPFPEQLHNRKMCGIVWCYTGKPESMEQAFRPVRQIRTPEFEHIGPIPFPAVQSMFDGLYSPGMQWYWRADFVKELSNDAIREHIRHGEQMPTMHSTMHLYPINGAVHRVGSKDTPFAYRDVNWAEVIVGVDPDPANNDRTISWTKRYWEALHPYSAGGAYVNFMMDEGQDRIRATYRDNYDRLAAIKSRYDPSNFFRVNQNIKPQAAATA